MSLFSIFSLPKNSENFDRGLYLPVHIKALTLFLYFTLPIIIVYMVMVPLSFIPYPFDWYLIVVLFFSTLFLNGLFFWAKGGVFFLFCWISTCLSFRFLPFLFSLFLPVHTINLNSKLSDLDQVKNRVLYIKDIPIQKETISKNNFTN